MRTAELHMPIDIQPMQSTAGRRDEAENGTF